MTTPANGTTARTGKDAKAVVDDELIARMTSWTFNPKVGETAWGDSDSAGFTNRAAGRKDGTGSIAGKFDDDTPTYDLFAAGDIVELVLWENDADYWALPSSLIQSFTLTYDQDSKEVVAWSSDFGADGRYYHPGEAGAPSHNLPT